MHVGFHGGKISVSMGGSGLDVSNTNRDKNLHLKVKTFHFYSLLKTLAFT